MAVEVLFSNGGHENTAFNDMLCLLMEKVAIETAMVVGKSALCLVLAMGTHSNGLKMLGNEIDINQGDEDSFPVQVMRKGSKGETQVPSQKDDGETDDDDDDEDEDADEQDDDDVGEVPSDEGKENEGNEGSEDELGVNGEGGSDDEDDDGEDDDEDDDEDEDEEDEEDDEDEEEAPEPPSKKRK